MRLILIFTSLGWGEDQIGYFLVHSRVSIKYSQKKSGSGEGRGKRERIPDCDRVSHRIKMIWDDNGNKKEKMDLRAVSSEKKNIPEHDNRPLTGIWWCPCRGTGCSSENLFQSYRGSCMMSKRKCLVGRCTNSDAWLACPGFREVD